MKFFVPYAECEEQAEALWAGIRLKLRDLGLASTPRRIQALPLGRGQLLPVGRHTPDGEPVLIILEASNADLFYVCTPSHGILEGVPYILGLKGHARPIDFEEEVVGRA